MAGSDSSVLFSLNELRSLELERIREEAEHDRLRAEAERRVREAEERRVREAEEARIRAAEEAERHATLERERLAAEERLRMREAELRAHAAAEARLEQARIEAEARARYALRPSFPYGRVIAGTLLSVGLVVVVLILVMQKRDAEVVKQSQAVAARLDAEQRALHEQQAAEKARFEAQLGELRDRLQHARGAAEAAALRKQIDEKRHIRSRPSHPVAAPAAAARPGVPLDPGSLDDPLKGLKLD